MTKIYESTGKLAIVEVSNLCDRYERGSMENAIKHFVLGKLAKTNSCPIKQVKQKNTLIFISIIVLKD